ncbi:hypothetical protein D9M72_588320 [compost metagenome]
MIQGIFQADVARGLADHHGQLDLPVQALAIDRHPDGRARADDGLARRLEKEEQPLRGLVRRIRHAHFREMVVVVGARAKHLAGVENGRKGWAVAAHLVSEEGFLPGRDLLEQRERGVPVVKEVPDGRGQRGDIESLGASRERIGSPVDLDAANGYGIDFSSFE